MATPGQKPPAPSAPPEPVIQASEPEDEQQPVVVGPVVEQVTMGGLVLSKTVTPDGNCTTEVLREPTIAPEQVRETSAAQRAQGF